MNPAISPAIRSLSGDKSPREQADEAVFQIRALKALTAGTGTRTRRTINEILQALPSDVLTLVAVDLVETK